YLRTSDIDGCKHTRAILKLLARKMQAAWPNVKITLRADSGFCRWRLLRYQAAGPRVQRGHSVPS
ncbi:MAG: transposase, partial [Myxococcales bacterium]